MTVGLVYLRLHAPGVFVRVTEGCEQLISRVSGSSTHAPPSKSSSNTGPCSKWQRWVLLLAESSFTVPDLSNG